MKIVKVTYTTKQEFAEQNASNIKAVMNELRKLKPTGINYNSCIGADGKTFIHTAFFRSEDDQKILNDLPAFKTFQQELKASGPETPPKQELLNLVGSANDLFNL